MSKWHKGPPPSVGWWPASVSRNANRFRWWDGRRWSAAVESNKSATEAQFAAREKILFIADDIEWTDRPDNWPERSKT